MTIEGAIVAVVAWEILKWLGRRALNWIAPVGYEDVTGFHYGRPPEDPL
jgi:hypothetical protein